ncbi:hypothetical protein COL516b_009136 [Colletotrichum fioriniae]|nr:uncharacterized protein COL516b_009136 [Colletotrichum fioriniae]KAJ0299629.1 hypothetical protein COL516b_009136 [Colletotrichum fioriniae]
MQDVENYVKSRLRFNNTALVEDLQPQLLEKAAGVFLWLILVVDILNTEYSQGGLALKKRLVELPSNLGALFKDILTRDSKNMEHLLLCVIWILCAKRPLRPKEFYHALWSGLSQNDLVDPDPPTVTSPEDEDSAIRCVIGFSKGLAEITKSTQPTVQFIHESVRDYLLKAGGLAELCPDLGFDWELSSHEKLKFPLEDWIRIYNRFEKYKIRQYTHQASLYYVCSGMDCSRLIPMIHGEDWRRRSEDRYNYPLFAALAQGNSKSVAALLGIPSVIYNGTDIMEGLTRTRDFSDFKKRTPLSWAAQNGRPGMVMLLLRAEYDVDELDYGELTPLHRAAEKGHESIAKLLIENGADVDSEGKRMRTPLLLAITHGREATVRILLENNANANGSSDKDYSSPLYEASLSGYKVDPPEAIVKLLVENGANIKYRHYDGGTALHAASEEGDERITKFFIENGADVNAVDKDQETALHRICCANGISLASPRRLTILETPGGPDARLQKIDEIINRLLNGVEPNVPSGIHRGDIGSKLASSFSYEEIVRLLVENKLYAEAVNDERAVHFSKKRDHDYHATAKVLIDNGAALNVLSTTGDTPLNLAVTTHDRQILQLFLESGADVDLMGGRGMPTPLISAICILREDMAVDLIKHGANVNFSDHTSMTPLSAARQAGCSAWLIRLLERLSDI